EAPQKGAVTGITYTASFDNPGLVATKLVGSTLKLTYNGKAAGLTTITVNATNGVDMASESFDVYLLPNLISSISQEGLQTLLVPGDSGKVKAAIQHTRGGGFKETVK